MEVMVMVSKEFRKIRGVWNDNGIPPVVDNLAEVTVIIGEEYWQGSKWQK